MKKKAKSLQRIAGTSVVSLLLYAIYWTIAATTPVELPKADQPAELYSNQNGNDLKQTYLSAIQSAKFSILVIVYGFNDPDVIKAINEKADAGLEVKVICDKKASPAIGKKLSKKVQLTKRSAPGLMHQKLMVIDEELCWIGSANMTTDSLRMHGNLVAGIKHPAIAEMIKEKSLGLYDKGRADIARVQSFLLDKQKAELWFLPDNPEAVDYLCKMIAEAKHSLRIAMFTWTHPVLTQAVIDAHERGVDVQVAIDYYAGRGAGAEVVKKLSDAGIAVTLSPGGALLHYKFLYRDENLLVNGSANWTRAAFRDNDDCFLVLHDLTEGQQTAMNKLWNTIRREGTLVQK